MTSIAARISRLRVAFNHRGRSQRRELSLPLAPTALTWFFIDRLRFVYQEIT